VSKHANYPDGGPNVAPPLPPRPVNSPPAKPKPAPFPKYADPGKRAA
jgi:hypothetical protein